MTKEMLATLTTVAIAFSVCCALGVVFVLRRYYQHQDESKEVLAELNALRLRLRSMVENQQRYQILVADWGPDFTGEDGTLPRWRWVVTDADLAVRLMVGDRSVAPGQMPFMLGNAHTRQDAMLAALRWVGDRAVVV